MHQACGDADGLMFKTAVACADKQDTILIEDSTDLLLLSCFHTTDTQYNFFFTAQKEILAV